MPPLGNKSKNKIKDNRQSRSRNTTPSSVLSAPTSAVSIDADATSYLKLPLRSLAVPNNLLYEDIVDRNGAGGIPDPRHLESLANYLRNLSELASSRENECDRAVRELKGRRQAVLDDEREREREQREKREAEEKAILKKAAEDRDEDESPKVGKHKRKRDASRAKEERPLAVGAHAVARQDGTDSKRKFISKPARFCKGQLVLPGLGYDRRRATVSWSTLTVASETFTKSKQGKATSWFRKLVFPFATITDAISHLGYIECGSCEARFSSTIEQLHGITPTASCC